jgi:uncharacterized protein involved in outer membrane biogenesis
VQTTLLAAGIAIILALVTALVGPSFVNWSDHRGLFEAQAARMTGVPVRIAGPISARLLPTPSVRLRDVEFGAASADGSPLRADELDVEFTLGSLLRGEWRAADMRISGANIALRLDERGRIAWPVAASGFAPDNLVLDKLSIQSSRIRIDQAASPDSGQVLDGFWFAGSARSLIGPLKGEGGFMVGGTRHGFRVTLGRVEDSAARVRLTFDTTERPIGIDAEGVVRLDSGVPQFEGALRLVQLAGVGVVRGRAINKEPWTLTSQVTARPAGVLFEQLELQYGGEERALRLSGAAELKLGPKPQLEAVVSARQLDIDRLLALPDATRRLPLVAVRTAAETLGDALLPDIPVRLGIGVESLTLAGGTVQTLRGDLVSDGRGWEIADLEFRAPGFTQVRASGRWSENAEGGAFTGPASIEAVDPRALAAWLEGRSAAVAAQGQPIGPLQASGVVTLAPGRIAVEQLKAVFDGKEVAGRFAYEPGSEAVRPKLDAAVNASELDIDATLRIVQSALPGVGMDFPARLALAFDIGRATVAGIEAVDAKAKLTLDDGGLVFERLTVGDLAGAALDVKGRIEGPWTAPRGNLTLDVSGARLDGVLAMLAKVSPVVADGLRPMAPQLGPAKLRVSLDVGATAAPATAVARARIEGSAGSLRVAADATLTGDPANWWGARLEAKGRIEAAEGVALARLLQLDPVVQVTAGQGLLHWSAAGPLDHDIRVEARITAVGLAIGSRGVLRAGAEGLSGAGEIEIEASDAIGLRPLIGRSGQPAAVRAKAKVDFTPDRIVFDALSGAVAGSPVNGRLAVAIGSPPRLEGRLDIEAIDGPALASALVGLPAVGADTGAARGRTAWPSQPFGLPVLAGLTGQLEIGAVRASLAPGLDIRQFRALLRFGESEAAIEDVSGSVAGGKLVANLVFPRSREGTSADLRLALTGADIASLLPGAARSPARGRVSVQFEAKGLGRSAASLVGALGGAGTISFEDIELTGFDPQVFEVATRAADQGVDVDPARVTRVVGAALEHGRLRIARADGTLGITAGQVRLGGMLAKGDRADLAVNAHLDLVQWALDARLALIGRAGGDAPAAGRPEVFVALRGAPLQPKRSIDTSALTGWLTLRAVDLQARRLQVLEQERRALEAERASDRGKASQGASPPPGPNPAQDEPKSPTSSMPPMTIPDDVAAPSAAPGRQPASARREAAVPAATAVDANAPAAAEAAPPSATAPAPARLPDAPARGRVGAQQGEQGVQRKPETASAAPQPDQLGPAAAPTLPPPINIVPAPKPRQAAPAPTQRRQASQDARLPQPPASAPAGPLRLFDLFGNAR